MKTSYFDYDLPVGLIAQEPPEQRGTSRMMVVHRNTGKFEHKYISDFPGYLNAGDMLVVNNTRVFPARIFGKRTSTGGKVELLLVEEMTGGEWPAVAKAVADRQVAGASVWNCFLKASSRPPVGEIFKLANGRIQGEVLDVLGERIVIKLFTEDNLLKVLQEEGFPPVPPYIKRDYSPGVCDSPPATRVAIDRERYQTVYAERVGAVAAPTAGLHFSKDLLQAISAKQVMRADITLHVGPGTFKPVEVDEVEEHVMEAEWYEVSEDTAKRINSVKSGGGRTFAVGSTTVRTLETVVSDDGTVMAGQGRSKLFIYPPYQFKAVDAMLTNFHLPGSSLLMMVSAFAGAGEAASKGQRGKSEELRAENRKQTRDGREIILAAYKEAIEQKYRFYSYGDCMLIL